MTLPYASSKSGAAREKEIRTMLKDAGATAVGFMVDDDADVVICQFRMNGRQVTVPMSIGAYAIAWQKSTPRGARTSAAHHLAKSRAQAEIAVWAVLADWVKAQTAMIACGFADQDTAFLSHIHMPDGRRVGDALAGPNSPLRLSSGHGR